MTLINKFAFKWPGQPMVFSRHTNNIEVNYYMPRHLCCSLDVQKVANCHPKSSSKSSGQLCNTGCWCPGCVLAIKSWTWFTFCYRWKIHGQSVELKWFGQWIHCLNLFSSKNSNLWYHLLQCEHLLNPKTEHLWVQDCWWDKKHCILIRRCGNWWIFFTISCCFICETINRLSPRHESPRVWKHGGLVVEDADHITATSLAEAMTCTLVACKQPSRSALSSCLILYCNLSSKGKKPKKEF